MSQSTIKMKLTKVNLGSKTLMEFCTEKVNAFRKKGLQDDYDDYIDAFDQELMNQYVIIGTDVYSISEKTENEYFTSVGKNTDGSFTFIINYNDGSSFWTEHLDEKDFK